MGDRESEIRALAAEIAAQANLVDEYRQRMLAVHAELHPYRNERNRLLSLLRLTYAKVVQVDPERYQPRDKWHDGNAVVALGRDWQEIASVRFTGCAREGYESGYQTHKCKVTTIIGQQERQPLFQKLDALNIPFGKLNEKSRMATIDLKIEERVLSALQANMLRLQKRKR